MILVLVGKGIGTSPPATGASGQMRDLIMKLCRSGELILPSFDRKEMCLELSSRASSALLPCLSHGASWPGAIAFIHQLAAGAKQK